MADSFLEAELNQLLAVGKITLPHLAWTYATLNNRVADTAGYDNTAFAPCPAAGPQDQLRGTWTGLRDRLQDILGRSARSFEAAAGDIVQVAASYEAVNAEVAAQIRKAWSDTAPDAAISSPDDKVLPPSPPRVVMAHD